MTERTLVLLKHDALARGLCGEVIARFERAGLRISAAKMHWADAELGNKHYNDIAERHGAHIRDILVEYLTEGPVIAFVLEGISAVKQVRKMVGATYPDEAAPGTIRGDYGHVSKDFANANKYHVKNLVHASATPEEAKAEIALWFTDKEIHAYETAHHAHIVGTRGSQ